MTTGQEGETSFLSIVIPAYSEEENIGNGALREVAGYLSCQKYASDLIIVDDSSADTTAALVAEAARRPSPH